MKMKWNRRKPTGRRRVVQERIPQLDDIKLVRDAYKQLHQVQRQDVASLMSRTKVKDDAAFVVDAEARRPTHHPI
jgi:hypothetical protein